MTIVRAPRPQGNFYILDKTISEDDRLSWAGRGLLVYLLGKPDYWRVSRQALVPETARSPKPTGRDGVSTSLTELMAAGYCTRVQPRLADGRHGPVEYQIHETPQGPAPDSPTPDSPAEDVPAPDGAAADKASRAATRTPALKSAVVPIAFDPQRGLFANVSEEVRARWREAFPLVNVDSEMVRAGSWLMANLVHDKKNYQRFLHNWLSRTQDRAAHQAQHASQPGGTASPAFRPMSRAERGQAAGMALLGIPAEAYLPGAPLWTGPGDVIDAQASVVPSHPEAL